MTLALENHGGGVTVTAEQLLRLVRDVDGPNFGVNLDTGNFHGPDPYAEIAAAAPYAVNVQVKTEIRRMGRTKEPPTWRGSSASSARRATRATRAGIQRPRGSHDRGPPLHQDTPVPDHLMVAGLSRETLD